MSRKGRTFRYLGGRGGGGLEFLLLHNFLYLRKKTYLFCDERQTFFFCFVEELK